MASVKKSKGDQRAAEKQWRKNDVVQPGLGTFPYHGVKNIPIPF